MIKYKLKKEARQFFHKDYEVTIKPTEFWQKENIHENLLDKVDNVHIDYGIASSDYSKNLSGWNSNDGEPNARYHFTVNIDGIASRNYNQVSVPDMMDEIQKVLNRYFERFVETE
jgi:hypothetical protein